MDVNSLPDDPRLLKQLLATIQQESARKFEQLEAEHRQELERLNDIIAWFKRKMFGPRSEKINANQLLLFGQSVMPLTSPEPAQAPVAVPVNRPRSHGRRIIPENLPREIITVDVPEQQKPCPDCGTVREKIGEEVSEQLEFIPARLFVRRFVRDKLACPKGCDASVVTAQKPVQVVEKGLAGPGLIAHIATSKYADHLPLYRIEGILARYGIEISRSTMCDWMADVAHLATPLVRLMRQRILQSRVIHTDDTTVPVQDVGKTKTGRLWVYLGDAENPYSVFDYTPDRKKEHPKAWLGEYDGYLQADAYGGYDDVYRTGAVKEVACWAHARRKFYDAKDKAPEVCRAAIEMIRRLYAIEDEAQGRLGQERMAIRQHKSVPILGEFQQWLHRTRGELLPRNPAAEAIAYALNQWEALKRYTQAGFLSIDNNAAEREMRPVALGRKNWLFAGSDEGGRTAAVLYSLIRSAARQELNVEYYLRSVLAHLPGTKLSELPGLLPDVWKRDLAEENAASPDPAIR